MLLSAILSDIWSLDILFSVNISQCNNNEAKSPLISHSELPARTLPTSLRVDVHIEDSNFHLIYSVHIFNKDIDCDKAIIVHKMEMFVMYIIVTSLQRANPQKVSTKLSHVIFKTVMYTRYYTHFKLL